MTFDDRYDPDPPTLTALALWLVLIAVVEAWDWWREPR